MKVTFKFCIIISTGLANPLLSFLFLLVTSFFHQSRLSPLPLSKSWRYVYHEQRMLQRRKTMSKNFFYLMTPYSSTKEKKQNLHEHKHCKSEMEWKYLFSRDFCASLYSQDHVHRWASVLLESKLGLQQDTNTVSQYLFTDCLLVARKKQNSNHTVEKSPRLGDQINITDEAQIDTVCPNCDTRRRIQVHLCSIPQKCRTPTQP